MRKSVARVLRALAACLLGIAIASLAGTVHAAPDAKELSRARAKFQQATELEQAGNWAGAIELFREVGQVKMTPQVRYHIAMCEERLGRLMAALGGYELAASDAAKVDPTFEKEVVARAEELRARIPKVRIKRGAGAAAAQIELDGVGLGSSSIGKELPVDPGPHQVSARAPGKEPFSTTVEVAEKETKDVEIELGGTAAATAAGPGPKDEGPKDETAEQPKQPSRVLPYVIGGVGIASLAASGVFFLMRQNAISKLEDECGPNGNQCPKSSESTYDQAKTYNVLSQVTLGVGVVGVGVAATLLLTQKSEPAKPKTGLRLAPAAPDAQAGFSVVGSF